MSDAARGEGPATGVASRRAVYGLFFLSGAAALVYEVSWSRLVGLAVGHTAEAAALVLAAYFTGLAIGQVAGGLLARRVPPLLGYGLAELSSAGWACVIPALLGWVGTPAASGEPELFRDWPAGRAAWCFLILLPATAPLGATLPFVVEALAAGGGPRSRGSVAYGLNTAGGLAGVVVATAWLLAVVGVAASGVVAAALSAACGLAACALALGRGVTADPEVPPAAVGDATPGPWAWTLLAALSGFGTMGLEVLYTRLFALVFHNSTYTFGAVVATFLLALSIAAAFATWLGRRIPPRAIATASFSLGGVALAVSAAAFPRLTGLEYFSFGQSFAGYLVGVFGLVLLFVLPPVALLGMTLPAAIQASAGGRAVGLLTAANTLAGAAGAVAAGFVLPPLFGLWPAFAAFVALFGLAGAALHLGGGRPWRAAGLGLAITGSVVVIVAGVPPDRGGSSREEVVRRWESAYGWVDVVRRDGALQVRENLHYRHGSTAKAVSEYRLGRLPLLLHPKPSAVAFLGLGTGQTAAPAVADRDVAEAVIVELIPEVVRAARLLASANLGVVDHPKVEVHVNDARQHLLRTGRRFDVIVSDLFVPWQSRAGYLYTAEFYDTARHRLKPGGLFCQWLALYQLGPEGFEMIADSFAAAFPHTTIWWGQFDLRYPIVALVGSERPLAVERAVVEGRLEAQADLPGGPDPDLRVVDDLAALYLGGWPRGRSRRPNTDEHPRLEFSAPIDQRDGRTLRGPALRRYFDDVFARLPSGDVRFGGGPGWVAVDEKRRRAVQRLNLFGE